MKKFLRQLILVITLFISFSLPVHAMEKLSLEEQLLEILVNSTIMTFENPQARESLSQLSFLIKDENTYQFIIQKIDKFILTNELEEYEEQAEALKEALTEMREFYIRSEKETLEKYNEMKKKQQEREKQRELKANDVIEV